jgi:hypothetical protein
MTTTSARHHLLGVWNPSYEADAMDEHLAVLLAHAREYRAGKRAEDDVYVWWGKVRSPHRLEPLPHLGEIVAIDAALSAGDEDDLPETHVYLTDYRSLYVAHLGGVTIDDIVADAGEAAHMPPYYREQGLRADCWFQLWDVRRVVLDDTPAVIAELRKLRNTRYHGQRVSLYGGMVELPLIVTREDEVRWFDERTRDQLTDGRHWVEFDAERAGTGEMQRELRDNRFGAALWEKLDPAARSFIASAEQIFRAMRADAAFDLSVVVVDFAKAVEVQANGLLRLALRHASDDLRFANVDGESRDVATAGPFTLGQLAHIIAEDRERCEWLRERLVHGEWFVASLPPVLRQLAGVRNAAAHGQPVAREEVVRLRNALVGIAGKGQLLDLAQVRVTP